MIWSEILPQRHKEHKVSQRNSLCNLCSLCLRGELETSNLEPRTKKLKLEPQTFFANRLLILLKNSGVIPR